MVLDAGASTTLIPRDIAEALGYDPARSLHRVRFMTGSGTEAAPEKSGKDDNVVDAEFKVQDDKK